jgi:dihydrofolate reductase
MRKITAGLFISLDGVVEAPDRWHFPYFNEEMGAAVDATLGAADTVLFGRKTYDSFAGAWPEREAAGGEDAHLDELRLLVHPIAVRKGMRLFDEGETPITLRLISSETFETGVLNLVYGTAESTGDATYKDAKVHLAQPER